MKWFKVMLTVCFSFLAAAGYSQMTMDKSVWTFEAKKKSGNQYELITHLKLEKGWHIYAMKPGGDGTLIAPSITYNANPAVKLTGTVKEKGKLISQNLEGIKGKVNMYSGTVDYVQTATITGPTTITGSYEYQICNDMMCLPPTTKQFKVAVK